MFFLSSGQMWVSWILGFWWWWGKGVWWAAQIQWSGITQLQSWGGLKAVTCALCLTWNSSSQFHFKGLSSAEGGLDTKSPPLCSLASPATLHPLFKTPLPPLNDCPDRPACSHPASAPFLVSPSHPPLSSSPLLPIPCEPEWTRGMRVTGTSRRETEENYIERNNRGSYFGKMWGRLEYRVEKKNCCYMLGHSQLQRLTNQIKSQVLIKQRKGFRNCLAPKIYILKLLLTKANVFFSSLAYLL